MRALSWLKDLVSSERGNVLVVGAATLPLLLGSAAFAIDTIQLTVWKRQLQRAADSSAIAGAYALAIEDDTHDAIHRDLDKNKFPVLTQEEGIFVGETPPYPQTVRVTLTATRSLPFVSLFTDHSSTMVAVATAALVPDGTFCLVSLYDKEGAGIVVGGNANVTLKCGIKTNALGDDTITASNNATLKADPVSSVGGIDIDGNHFASGTNFQPYAAAQVDPFGYIPNPDVPAGCDPASELNAGNVPTASGTYCYGSINVKPSDILNLPSNSTIIVNGGLVNLQGDINGTHTAIVMTGAGGQAGDLKINAGAKLNLTAPTTGTYQGVLFFRDRRAAKVDIKINGNSQSKLEGAMYFPTADLEFNGNSTWDVKCLQMVGRILSFKGTADITNVCPTGSGSAALRQTVVRLIG